MEFSTLENVETIFSAVDNKGAMLDLLAAAAAVVSGEQASNKDVAAASPKSPPNCKKQKHRPNGLRKMSVKQLQSLSANQLINLFALLEGDEMKKTFYYQCRFTPVCSMRFHSFGSEDRARLLIKDHLLKHVQNLEPDFQVDTPQKKQEKQVSQKQEKPVSHKKQIVKVLKKMEKAKIVNSSVSGDGFAEPLPAIQVPSTPTAQASWSTSCNYEHDYNLCLSMPQFMDSSPSETVIIDFNADQKTVILREPVETHLSDANNIFDQEIIDDWLSVCQEEIVVSSEETPFVVNTDDEQKPEECNIAVIDIKQDVEEEVVGMKEEEVETSIETCPPAVNNTPLDCTLGKERKPKGKAKFIGQSDAEKQMAMQMIKAVRRKQMDSDKLECKICKPPRLFTAPTTLISHYRSHAGIKPYECPLCKSVFTRQHSLNYHILIHLNQTRFTCDVCDRKFRHPSHFKEHQRRHTGESPFQCADCSLRFKTRNTYKRHLKTRHGKVLTQSGGITLLSEEEFKRVRTFPRQKQVTREPLKNADLDKENSRIEQPARPRLMFGMREKEMTEMSQSLDNSVIEASNAITISLPVTGHVEHIPPTITLLTPNNINYFPQKQQVS